MRPFDPIRISVVALAAAALTWAASRPSHRESTRPPGIPAPVDVHAQSNPPPASSAVEAGLARVPGTGTPSARSHATVRPNARVQPHSPAAAGVVVAIDPETGQLRMPTPEELAALRASQPSAEVVEGLNHSSEGLRQIQHADGHVSLELDGRFMEFAIATIGQDGKVRFDCVDQAEALQPASSSKPPAPAPAPLEDR